MKSLTLLRDLAACATDGEQPELAMTRALAIARVGLGCEEAVHVQGTHQASPLDEAVRALGLSEAEVRQIQRQLLDDAGDGVFRPDNGRIIRLGDGSEPATGDYLAALIPVSGRPTDVLIARGPWKPARATSRSAFLRVALPLLARIADREVASHHARRTGDRLRTVASLYSGATDTDTLSLILTRMTRVAAALTGVDYVSIDLLGPGQGVSVRCTNVFGADAPEEAVLNRSDWLRSSTIRTRTPVIVRDVMREPRISDAGRAYFVRNQIRSVAAFPLLTADSVIGVLGVATTRRREFSQDDIGMLTGLANEAARVVDGIRKDERLQEQESLLHTVVEHAPLVLFALDRHGLFTLSEGKGLERLGLKPGEAIGRSAFDVYADNEQIVKNLRRALVGESFTSVAEVAGLTYETYYAPVLDGEGVVCGIIGVATDVTDRARAANALMEQARRDSLTGLLNHASITQELSELLSRNANAPFAIAVIDVDSLKAVNDTYGHQIGDTVLTTVAGVISKEDVSAGRSGGDEFLVILPGADRVAAAQYAERVSEELASVRLVDPDTGATVPVIVSIGFAAYPVEAETPDALIRLADAAMYATKHKRELGSPSMSSG